MPSEWTRLTIGDLVRSGEALVQTGPFGSQLHKHDYVDDGVPVIPTEAIGKGRILGVEVPKVNAVKANELARHRLVSGDILFARRGAQATGLSAIVGQRHEGALCGTGALLLRLSSKRVLSHYLSLYLSSDFAYEWLTTHAVGAVMPNLNTEIIKALPLTLPSISEQREVSYFLGALDDKIALLRETNATLEAIAQALFKSWFVDFDPVRAKAEGREPEGVPPEIAALFPSEFENSALGEIPKGWRVGKLGDLLQQRVERSKPSTQTEFLPYVPIECITSKSVFLADAKSGTEAQSSLTLFKEGDILFGAMRPYFHKVCLAPFDGVTRTTAFVLKAKQPEFSMFALFKVFHDATIDFATTHSEGSTIPYAKWSGSLDGMGIVLPSRSIAAAFGDVVVVLMQRGIQNAKQTQSLKELRYTLLPQLMSGKLQLNGDIGSVEEAQGANHVS